MNTANTHTVFITCADNLESALLSELVHLGIDASIVQTGRIKADLTIAQIYRICLYSRIASRVLLPLGECAISDDLVGDAQSHNRYATNHTQNSDAHQNLPNLLYRTSLAIAWDKYFGLENSFKIRTSVDKRANVHQNFAMLRIKDAIADYFYQKYDARPDVDAKNADVVILVHIGAKTAEWFLDLSGQSLHKRGYRVASTSAPLKENLAAALLYSAGWHHGNYNVLIDPMCGSGTLVLEALLIRLGHPAGLQSLQKNGHAQFGASGWLLHNETLWQDIVAQSIQQFEQNLHEFDPKSLTIFAQDGDLQAIKALCQNLQASAAAAIIGIVYEQKQTLNRLPRVFDSAMFSRIENPKTLIITNPPYGERLGQDIHIRALYQGLGLLCQNVPQHTTLAVLAPEIELADVLPIMQPKTLRVKNGAIPVYFRYGLLQKLPCNALINRYQKQAVLLDEDEYHTQEFINRLQKNIAHLKKTAMQHNVQNLRIYDADLPNFNLAVDIYGVFVHVQEYAPPKSVDTKVAHGRFLAALFAIRQVLGVSREQVFIKTRAKQAGKAQYMRQNSTAKKYVVRENDAYFYVNFTDYLDTGLFIDHRNMRHIIYQNSQNKSVLNLFAYTCTASVQAALGGAKHVTSVDLSDNYLSWGRDNFALNGLDVEKYQFVAADVFEWVKQNTESFDVIFIDPPTFSNSKKFFGTFDVQRDHAALIRRAMNRLNTDGVLYFSNNFSKFVLDNDLKNSFDIVDITHKTTGFDFKKGIHQSYQIMHKSIYKSAMHSKNIIMGDNASKSVDNINNKNDTPEQNKKYKNKINNNEYTKNKNSRYNNAYKNSYTKNKMHHKNKNSKPKNNVLIATGENTRIYINPKYKNNNDD